MNARLVGLVLEHYPIGGNEFALAIVLADEAQHSGGISASPIKELARLSRQSENNTRRLLQKMEESGWLICIERSKGGHGRPSVYQINPEWVRLPIAFVFGKEPSNHGRDEPYQPSNPGRDEPSKNPTTLGGFSRETVPDSQGTPSLFKNIPPYIPPSLSESAGPSVTEPDGEDHRLSLWILEQLRTLNPSHKPPSWKRWDREIRLMVRDGHSHREIAELFAWANRDRTPRAGSDFCWAKVILSPGKLRAKWDQLVIQRGSMQPAMKPAEQDPNCQHCHDRRASVQQGKTGMRLCSVCADALEAMA